MPPHAGSQPGSVVGSITGGPVHGQVNVSGGFFGASHARLQAPVGAVGSADVGSKQGTHFSLAAQTSVGKSEALEATSGRQVDKQRPSTPAIELHDFGTKLPLDEMSGSGAQKPATLPLAVQALKSFCWAAGTKLAGTQCAPPQAGLHAANPAGSTSGGPS